MNNTGITDNEVSTTNYDRPIKKIRKYLQERPVREFESPSAIDELKQNLPVRVGPGSNPGVILRSDVFAEMGNPAEGSNGFIIWTRDLSLVRDGLISVVGPDIPEMNEGASVPFGQVIMVAGKDLGPSLQERIEDARYVSDQIEGYLVRDSSKGVWGRVSRDAVAKGFTLETLGRALMITMKSSLPQIEAVEIVLVTSNRRDIDHLGEIAEEVAAIRKGVISSAWKEKGYEWAGAGSRHAGADRSRGGCA